ncbi:MAG: hypothetical protein ACLURP_14005 [Ruminococcus sp.]
MRLPGKIILERDQKYIKKSWAERRCQNDARDGQKGVYQAGRHFSRMIWLQQTILWDYLLRTGNISLEEYLEKQEMAKEILIKSGK